MREQLLAADLAMISASPQGFVRVTQGNFTLRMGRVKVQDTQYFPSCREDSGVYFKDSIGRFALQDQQEPCVHCAWGVSLQFL